MTLRSSEMHDADSVAKLGLVELNYEIARCAARMKVAPTAMAKQAFAERLKWLEAFKIRHHFVPKD